MRTAHESATATEMGAAAPGEMGATASGKVPAATTAEAVLGICQSRGTRYRDAQ
jgi:hypothetical protein